MAKTPEKDRIALEAELILERLKSAEKTEDFDVLSANLAIIRDFIATHTSSGVFKIPGDDKDVLKKQLRASFRRLKAITTIEEQRRDEIKKAGDEYDKVKKGLEEYDEAKNNYKSIIASPAAQTFTYPATPFNIDALSPQDAALVDYFDTIVNALEINPSDVEGKGLDFIEQKIRDAEQKMDDLAFTINSKNGIYDEKVIFEDLRRAQELEEKLASPQKFRALKDVIKTSNRTIYNNLFPKSGVLDLDALTAQINALGNPPKNTPKYNLLTQLKDLQKLNEAKKFTSTDKKDFDDELRVLYNKYGVTTLEELKKVAANTQTNDIQTHSVSKIASSSILEQINDPAHMVSDQPLESYGIGDSANPTGNDIESCANFLSQQDGFKPMVGRATIVYAKPVFKKKTLSKRFLEIFSAEKTPDIIATKMEVVEESIDKIIAEPKEHYHAALIEANNKRISLGLDPIKKEVLENCEKQLEELVNGGELDEVLKRILSLKCSNTRAQLMQIASHSNAGKLKDPSLIPEHYDPPKIEVREERRLFGKVNHYTCNREQAGYTSPPAKPSPHFSYSPSNRGNAPAVSSRALRDRTHHKDNGDMDEIG